METKNEKIRKAFKALRENKTYNSIKDRCYTVRELASKMGDEKYYSRISQIENGHCMPSIADTVRYHNYFKVPYEYLMGETNNTKQENISINKVLGLTDEAIQTIKRFSTYSKTIDMFNVLLSGTNGTQFEGILFFLQGYREKAKIKIFESNTGERINEARRQYAKKHNLKYEDINFPLTDDRPENHEITNLFMDISSKSEKVKEDKLILKLKMLECVDKIFNNFENNNIEVDKNGKYSTKKK